MSVYALSFVWKSGAYDGGLLLVLLAMADHANDDGGSIYPTVRTLCRKARLKDRQVRYCVKRLREDGVIEVDPSVGETKNRAIPYRINFERLRSLAEKHERDRQNLQDAPDSSEQGQSSAGMPLQLGADNNRQSKPPLNHQAAADAADGEKPGAKKTKNRTVIGDWRPGDVDQAKAIRFWTERSRHDLVSNIAVIVQHFCKHHSSTGTRMANWPDAWETWYVRALKDRPMPAAGPRVAAVEGVTIERWVYRLVAWFIGHPDDGVSQAIGPRYWHQTWGPSPKDRDGCQAPPEAWAEFRRLHPGKAA